MTFEIPKTPPAYYHHIKEPSISKYSPVFVKDENLKIKLNELYSKTDSKSSYELTIPLLVSAQMGEVDLYKAILQKIYHNLGLTPKMTSEEFRSVVAGWAENASCNIWLLGRVLVSADNVQDTEIANEVAALMNDSLHSIKQADPFSTWAWGYLAVHYASDETNYSYYRTKMLESKDSLKQQAGEKEGDNVQWALVMDILAAGSANDYFTYTQLIEEFKAWTDKKTIVEAISTIPKKDFTAWALAIVRVAAAKVKDIDTYNELALSLEQAIQTSPSEQDKLLAQVNNLLSNLLL